MIRSNVMTACVGLLLALAAFGEVRAATQAPASGPAEWFNYDMLVDLQDLPRAYTCDELWYKFRAVLLAIGAAPKVDVTPLRCDIRSPQVQVRFSLPHVLHGKFVRYSSIRAMTSTVELRPGDPRYLAASDCSFITQVKDTMFRDLPIRVVNADLPCASSVAHPKAFSVTLETLRAESESGPSRAARDGLKSPPRASNPQEQHE
jgi:hypothetical protein